MFKTLEVKMLPSETVVNCADNNIIGLHIREGFLHLCKSYGVLDEYRYKPQHLYGLLKISNNQIYKGDYYFDEKNQHIVQATCDLKKTKIKTNYKVVLSSDTTLNLPLFSIDYIKLYVSLYNKETPLHEINVEFNDVSLCESSENYDDNDIYVNDTKICSIDCNDSYNQEKTIAKYDIPLLDSGTINIKTNTDVDSEK